MNKEIVVTEKKHYLSIDGLRALSCIGIMMMHIQANTHYQLAGFVWQKLIPSFTHLVILFIMISGFGMCVGYLDRFLNGTVDLEKFYKRRYQKILPYFVFLIIIALIYEPTVTNFYDATMEFLLVYGFLPNNALNVIGVGWTIGVIFVFYFLFPAFSVLMKTKRRAWIFLFIAFWINFVCSRHYFSDFYVNDLFAARHSFIWCLPLFMGGGNVSIQKSN
ncbi:MAG: acyltransferase [Spirochaetales bacterium]|nr:acyltransferase [Spirochaetales bacterium]MDY5915459.1 acyltransferase [Treponema sp.]